MLGVLVVIALLLWIFGGDIMEATTAALVVISLMLILKVVTWDDIISNKAAWNTLAWFATLVALADGLTRVGFVKWFAETVAAQLAGVSPHDGDPRAAADQLLRPLPVRQRAPRTSPPCSRCCSRSASTIPGINMHTLALGLCLQLGIMGIITPVRDRPEPGVLRQRLPAGGGLLAPGRDLRRDLFRRVSWRSACPGCCSYGERRLHRILVITGRARWYYECHTQIGEAYTGQHASYQ